jgi:hypothetical protein
VRKKDIRDEEDSEGVNIPSIMLDIILLGMKGGDICMSRVYKEGMLRQSK